MDIKLTHRASTTHLLYSSRVRAGLVSVPFVILPTLTPECRNCPQLGNHLPIHRVSPLCFGAFDLHLLDFNRRTHLAISIPFTELGQEM